MPDGVIEDEQKPAEQPGFQPITSQEQLDALIQSRLARAKPADYDEVKLELQKLRDEKKTELELAQSKAEQLESELAAERQVRLRIEVAAEKGIPSSLLRGSSREEMETLADELLAFKATQEVVSEEPIQPRPGFNPAQNGSVGFDDKDATEAFARQLFGL